MPKTLQQVVATINLFQQQSNVPIVQRTPVVSPLYPGQFCYCLDEIHWLERYGNFIDIPAGESFQKIQPAIRMRDYEAFYCGGKQSSQHLGLFTMATVTGGHIVTRENGREYYKESVHKILQLLSSIGLDPKRLKVTYFSGNTAGNIEMSRKKETQERKVLINNYIPKDDFKEILLECGLKNTQLEGINTRDNFLTSNWYNIIVPWGYRNEFLYLLPNGEYLDIGTIERLNIEPIVEKRNNGYYVVAIKDWDRCVNIDVVGIERLIMAIESATNIHSISLFKSFANINKSVIEAIRILHRIFTDVEWKIIGKHRKDRLRFLMRTIKDLPSDYLFKLLHIHAQQYKTIFPELENGIEKTIQEIENFRRRTNQ